MIDIFSKEFNDNINNFVGKMIEENEKSLSSENLDSKIYLNTLLIDYLRKLGRSIEEDYSDVIPVSFELLSNESKIEVLNDCLNNQIVIEKSSVYTSLLEGDFEEKKTEDFGIMI